jgi:hypothetical protein
MRTGTETRLDIIRQWSALLVEQFVGWGAMICCVLGLFLPKIVPALVASHPFHFAAVGLGLLSGKRAALLLKKLAGALA